MNANLFPFPQIWITKGHNTVFEKIFPSITFAKSPLLCEVVSLESFFVPLVYLSFLAGMLTGIALNIYRWIWEGWHLFFYGLMYFNSKLTGTAQKTDNIKNILACRTAQLEKYSEWMESTVWWKCYKHHLVAINKTFTCF